jgi:hypothetical protein
MSLRRSKMLSFRVSPEEHAQLRKICEARRIRSLSDFARMAVQNMAGSADEREPLWHEVAALRDQLAAIARELDRVTSELESRRSVV